MHSILQVAGGSRKAVVSRFVAGAVTVAIASSLMAIPAYAQETTPAAELASEAQQEVRELDSETAETVVEAIGSAVAVEGVAEAVADSTKELNDGSTVTKANGVVIEIPASGDQPVEVSTPTGPVSIELPVPAGTEAVVVDGVSVFPTEHGAVMQHATDNGGTQTSFVLDGPDAATTYPVTITANEGGSLRLEADGGVIVLNPDGTISSGLAAPWAKDKTGESVPTWYTVNGNIVTQHVDVSGVESWPVIADPFWSAFGNYMGCILGIGVPIGAAFVIVSLPQTWYWVNRMATGTVMTGRVNGLVTYATWTRDRSRGSYAKE